MQLGVETVTDPTQTASDSPYIGLSYYTEALADVFFGRDDERTLIIGNLRAARLTVLYAHSGVGKSSLLRAGVAARLRELAARNMTERGSARFIPVVFAAWQDEPVDDLIDELERAIALFARDPEVKLPRGRLDEAIDAAIAATGATLLVILDQFEEYFLYGVTESEPGRFADQLARCINRRELAANFLVAVREDAYAGVGDLLRGKVSNPYGNNFNLEYLDRDAAREAITGPIDRYNAVHPGEQPRQIEPALVEAVLDQVRTGEVAFEYAGRGTVATRDGAGPARERIETPYLQLVMTALWDRERNAGSPLLRKQTLDELGGAQAIVRSHLDRAMSQLPDAERETAFEVFNHLVTPSGTKIVHAIPDLALYSGSDGAVVQSLVDKLSSGEERILRPVPPAPGETAPRVEIFHDVLAPAILAWRAAQASERLKRERREAEDRANRERRRARTFRAMAAVSSVLLVVAVVTVILARTEANRAHRAQHLALSRQLAADALNDLHAGNLGRGALLSLEAYRFSQTAVARSDLFQAEQATGSMVALLGGHTAYVTSVAYSPDGSLIASGSGDGTVLLQSIATGRTVRELSGNFGLVGSIAFSPNGKLLASGAGNDVVLYSVASGRPVRKLGFSSPVNGVAFSPNGTTVAAALASGSLVLSDADSGRRLLSVRADGAQLAAVAFSSNGRTVAGASFDRTVILWNALSGAREQTLRGQAGQINNLAFAPNGRTLASVGQDGSVIVWSLATSRPLLTFRASKSPVNAVAFSPSGSILATAGDDHNVILWSSSSGRQLQILRGHSAAVEAVAFSPTGTTLASGGDDDNVIVWYARPDLLERELSSSSPPLTVAYSPNGKLIATGNVDGSVLLWDPATGALLRSLRGHTTPVESVAFAPNSQTVAAASTDQTVILWNAQTGARERALRGHTDVVYAVAVSPDGRTLASGSADQTVILWNAQTGARERTLRGQSDFVYSVAFSPNSKLIAAGSADKSIIVWNATTGRRVETLTGQTAAVESVAFSPDGQTIAGGSDDGTVMLWNTRTGRPVGSPLQGATGSVLSVAFSPKGRILASGTAGHTAIVWDLDSGLGQPVLGHTGPVQSVAFSPDGSTLASASLDQTVQLNGPFPSKVDFAAVSARLCGVVRRNLTKVEWNQFLPGQPYETTCPSQP